MASAAATKKERGQFYTANSTYILDGLSPPPPGSVKLVEPFAGKGDLLTWAAARGIDLPVEAYDVEPKAPGIVQRDTLLSPPNYAGAWVLTNPPYLARNKCADKSLFDAYDTNDLFKCFLKSLARQDVPASGGIFIVPAAFFLSPRDLDFKCRDAFLLRYRLTRVKFFEETVFPDTPTTVVAFSFECGAEPLTEQAVDWMLMPSGETRTFAMSRQNGWVVGGDIYRLPQALGVSFGRHVTGHALKPGEFMTALTLNALDSGKADGRISLTYREGYVYSSKESSRTFATLVSRGREFTPKEQVRICVGFNELLERKRNETWSLFLPQYRESKDYARKRIPFELAYAIASHVVSGW